MLKIIKTGIKEDSVVPMSEMKPLQVGTICAGKAYGTIVMRTSRGDRFEVMNLSNPALDICWVRPSTIPVKLLPVGEAITISLFNE